MIAHYSAKTQHDFEKMANQYLENILQYMNHPDQEMSHKVTLAMNAIFKKVSKEMQFALVPTIRTAIEQQCLEFVGKGSKHYGHALEFMYKKKVEVLGIVRTDEGLKSLVEVVQAAIMHGSLSVRIDAAFCFKYILDFAPKLNRETVIKVCGALIRVANDKFP